MADDPYRILRTQLETAIEKLPLRIVQFTVLVGEGDESNHAAVMYEIDSDKLGQDVEKVAEQAAVDAQFEAMMRDQRTAEEAEKAKAAEAEAEAMLAELAAEQEEQDRANVADLLGLLDD